MTTDSFDAVPLDVRLMNLASLALCVLALGAVLSGAFWYLLRHPAVAIQKIVVTGDTQHSNAPTLRANVLPRLQGNFFTLDMQQAQRAFEQVPWVRQAVVRRDFPSGLQVRLEEHQAVALFGAEREEAMVNDKGEVFFANAADASQDLPRFIGQESRAKEIMRMHAALKAVFAPLDLDVTEVELSARGSWRITLDNDAVLELGRGDDAAVLQTARRFAQTVTSASAQMGRTPQDLEFADLRYASGFALRLRGIAVQALPINPKR